MGTVRRGGGAGRSALGVGASQQVWQGEGVEDEGKRNGSSCIVKVKVMRFCVGLRKETGSKERNEDERFGCKGLYNNMALRVPKLTEGS